MAALPRDVLPQIPKNKLSEFIQFVKERDIPVKIGKISVAKLKPIQSEVNAEKVEHMKQDAKALKQPLIISKDGCILDGHHRWVALKELDDDMPANVILCVCPIKELVSLGHQFDGSFTKTIHEMTIYAKGLFEDDALPIVKKTLYPY